MRDLTRAARDSHGRLLRWVTVGARPRARRLVKRPRGNGESESECAHALMTAGHAERSRPHIRVQRFQC
jgi:hypothetical protein